jgi:hypothetical protein
MTIQRTVLFAIAGLMISTNASAQCSRARQIIITPDYYHRTAYVRPHVSVHPHHSHYRQTVERPPAPSEIVFGGYTHTDELAAQLELLMTELTLDLYYNYSHNPGFQETYTEAYTLFQTAQYIHAAEHNYDRATVTQRLGGADALLHHIEDDVRGWSRIPRRQIGSLGIVTKLQNAVDTLHHLMEDVGVSTATGLEVPPAPETFSAVPPAPTF